jgi:hypothetical protein
MEIITHAEASLCEAKKALEVNGASSAPAAGGYIAGRASHLPTWGSELERGRNGI